jgi:hypothetical protein
MLRVAPQELNSMTPALLLLASDVFVAVALIASYHSALTLFCGFQIQDSL